MLPKDFNKLITINKVHEFERLLTLDNKNILFDLLYGGLRKTHAQNKLKFEKEKKMLLEEFKYLGLRYLQYSKINNKKNIQKLMDEIGYLKFTNYSIKKSFYEKQYIIYFSIFLFCILCKI